MFSSVWFGDGYLIEETPAVVNIFSRMFKLTLTPWTNFSTEGYVFVLSAENPRKKTREIEEHD
jgi:hypothetical protein